ncbi:uncharacterized protein LOC120327688 isoform X1 [Styela clava]
MYNSTSWQDSIIPIKTNVVIAERNRSLGLRGWNSHRSPLRHYGDRVVASVNLDNSKFELPPRTKTTFITAFSPDNTLLASCHGDHNIHILDLKTKKLVKSLSGHERSPWCVTFHPGSNEILATGSLNGEVRVWDLRGEGSESWTVDNNELVAIASLSFHPYDHVLAIAAGNEIHFWDWSLPHPFASVKTNSESEKVRFVRFDPWGHSIITGVGNAEDDEEDEPTFDHWSWLFAPSSRSWRTGSGDFRPASRYRSRRRPPHAATATREPGSISSELPLGDASNSTDFSEHSRRTRHSIRRRVSRFHNERGRNENYAENTESDMTLVDETPTEDSTRQNPLAEAHQRIWHARVNVNAQIRQQCTRLQMLRQERHRLELRLRELQNSANEVRNSTPMFNSVTGGVNTRTILDDPEHHQVAAPYTTSIQNSVDNVRRQRERLLDVLNIRRTDRSSVTSSTTSSSSTQNVSTNLRPGFRSTIYQPQRGTLTEPEALYRPTTQSFQPSYHELTGRIPSANLSLTSTLDTYTTPRIAPYVSFPNFSGPSRRDILHSHLRSLREEILQQQLSSVTTATTSRAMYGTFSNLSPGNFSIAATSTTDSGRRRNVISAPSEETLMRPSYMASNVASDLWDAAVTTPEASEDNLLPPRLLTLANTAQSLERDNLGLRSSPYLRRETPISMADRESYSLARLTRQISPNPEVNWISATSLDSAIDGLATLPSEENSTSTATRSSSNSNEMMEIDISDVQSAVTLENLASSPPRERYINFRDSYLNRNFGSSFEHSPPQNITRQIERRNASLNLLEPDSTSLGSSNLDSLGLRYLNTEENSSSPPSSTGLNLPEPVFTTRNWLGQEIGQTSNTSGLNQLEPVSTSQNHIEPDQSNQNNLGPDRTSEHESRRQYSMSRLRSLQSLIQMTRNQSSESATLTSSGMSAYLRHMSAIEPPAYSSVSTASPTLETFTLSSSAPQSNTVREDAADFPVGDESTSASSSRTSSRVPSLVGSETVDLSDLLGESSESLTPPSGMNSITDSSPFNENTITSAESLSIAVDSLIEATDSLSEAANNLLLAAATSTANFTTQELPPVSSLATYISTPSFTASSASIASPISTSVHSSAITNTSHSAARTSMAPNQRSTINIIRDAIMNTRVTLEPRVSMSTPMPDTLERFGIRTSIPSPRSYRVLQPPRSMQRATSVQPRHTMQTTVPSIARQATSRIPVRLGARPFETDVNVLRDRWSRLNDRSPLYQHEEEIQPEIRMENNNIWMPDWSRRGVGNPLDNSNNLQSSDSQRPALRFDIPLIIERESAGNTTMTQQYGDDTSQQEQNGGARSRDDLPDLTRRSDWPSAPRPAWRESDTQVPNAPTGNSSTRNIAQTYVEPPPVRPNSRGVFGRQQQGRSHRQLRRTRNSMRSNINRIISTVYAENHGHRAVVQNIDNMTYRLQYWDFTKLKLPEISRSDVNVLVPHCKIYNDASVDISQDGRLLATFVPTFVGYPDNMMNVGVFSLEPSTFGQLLFKKSYGPNAVCLSISPLCNYICVGLKSRQFLLGESRPNRYLMGQILELTNENTAEMPVVKSVCHPAQDRPHRPVSINTMSWSPEVGGGLVYGTNNGDLRICTLSSKPSETENEENNSIPVLIMRV